jgi:hypothetical protein
VKVGLSIYSKVFSCFFTSSKYVHRTSMRLIIEFEIGDMTAGSISIVEKPLT